MCESGKFLLVESIIHNQESWVLESGKQLKESGFHQKLESECKSDKIPDSKTWNLIHGGEFKIQSWIPFHEATQGS